MVELSNSWRKAWNLACNSGSNQERPMLYDEELGEESYYAEDEPYKEEPIPEDAPRRTVSNSQVMQGGWIEDR